MEDDNDVKTLMRGMTRRNGEAQVSSRTLAELFRKEHGHVLRDIKALDVPDAFRASNFGAVSARDEMGRLQPEYLLTRDGAMLLVMGWTGREAMRWKVKLIAAFRAMEEEIVRLKSAGVSEFVMRCLRAEPCDWSVMFEGPTVEAICEMYGWEMDGKRVPRQMASIFEKLYRIVLGVEVYHELKKRNPEPRHGSNHHQHLDDTVREEFKRASGFLVFAAQKAGRNPDIFWAEVEQYYGARQVELFRREVLQ